MTPVKSATRELVAHDKLSLEEFLDRWEASPGIKRAELIGGIVHLPSPVGFEHGDMENVIATWAGTYEIHTPGCIASNNATMLVEGNSPQPDVHIRRVPAVGGRSTPRGRYLQGAPEFVIEVCVSRTSYDLHQKLDLYETAGVYEYLAVLMEEQEIRWHRLVNDEFQLMPPADDGILRSLVFPGLWLDGKALLDGNKARVMGVLHQGLSSPEHAQFVDQLKQKATNHV